MIAVGRPVSCVSAGNLVVSEQLFVSRFWRHILFWVYAGVERRGRREGRWGFIFVRTREDLPLDKVQKEGTF